LHSLLAARQDWEGWDARNGDRERKRPCPFGDGAASTEAKV